jgi:hypothetical protein
LTITSEGAVVACGADVGDVPVEGAVVGPPAGVAVAAAPQAMAIISTKAPTTAIRPLLQNLDLKSFLGSTMYQLLF